MPHDEPSECGKVGFDMRRYRDRLWFVWTYDLTMGLLTRGRCGLKPRDVTGAGGIPHRWIIIGEGYGFEKGVYTRILVFARLLGALFGLGNTRHIAQFPVYGS